MLNGFKHVFFTCCKHLFSLGSSIKVKRRTNGTGAALATLPQSLACHELVNQVAGAIHFPTQVEQQIMASATVSQQSQLQSSQKKVSQGVRRLLMEAAEMEAEQSPDLTAQPLEVRPNLSTFLSHRLLIVLPVTLVG